MSKKSGFILFHEYDELLKDFSDEQLGIFMRAIFMYEKSGIVSELPPLMKMAFGFIKKDLDNNREKWKKITEKRSEAGKKGGAPIGNKNAQAKQPKQTDNDHSCDLDQSLVTQEVCVDKYTHDIGKGKKKTYGQYKNVHLTDGEHKHLMEICDGTIGSEALEHFSKRKAIMGYDYERDFLAIMDWAIGDIIDNRKKSNELSIHT